MKKFHKDRAPLPAPAAADAARTWAAGGQPCNIDACLLNDIKKLESFT